MKDKKNIVNTTVKEKLLRIVEDAKGDNLERAEAAFRNCTEKNMNEQYGQSGLTRREILDGYRKERKDWNTAYELAKSICC